MTSKHFKNAKYVLYTPYLCVKCLLTTARAERTPGKSQYFKSKANITHIDICT